MTKGKKIDERLEDAADRLIKSGKVQKAMALLDARIVKNPGMKRAYEGASFIYWSNGLYGPAKDIHRRYRAQFGKDLSSDVSLKELEEEEKNAKAQLAPVHKGDRWIFRQRWPRLNALFFWRKPIPQIEIGPQGIALIGPRGRKTIMWEQVLEARLEVTPEEHRDVRLLKLKTKDAVITISELDYEKGHLLIEAAIPSFLKVKHYKRVYHRAIAYITWGLIPLSLLGKLFGFWSVGWLYPPIALLIIASYLDSRFPKYRR